MRVLQLIDSLRPGGAERMAVSYANALVGRVESSFLCTSRLEGLLKKSLKPEVGYLYLDKKHTFDVAAILKLKKFIWVEEINIVHAHGSSFFIPALLKLAGMNFKLIWHNHFGNTPHLNYIQRTNLSFFSRTFDGIITVNSGIKKWIIENLKCKRVVMFRNFIPITSQLSESGSVLEGGKNEIKIICLANLRPEKGHFNLIRSFEGLGHLYNCSLHLVGGNPGNKYATQVLNYIKYSPSGDKIHYYGTRVDIDNLLKQADIGVLASNYEGLPVALLEYGIAGLPVIVTDVGECRKIIGNHGIVVAFDNIEDLTKSLKVYLDHPLQRQMDAQNFNFKIKNEYSETKVIPEVVSYYKTILGI